MSGAGATGSFRRTEVACQLVEHSIATGPGSDWELTESLVIADISSHFAQRRLFSG